MDFHGVHVHHFVYMDRIVARLEQSFLANSFVCKHDLLYHVQAIEVNLFVLAHCFLLVLNACIFVFSIWEQLLWLHWNFDFT